MGRVLLVTAVIPKEIPEIVRFFDKAGFYSKLTKLKAGMFNKSVKELKSVTTSAGSHANLIITEYPGRSEKKKKKLSSTVPTAITTGVQDPAHRLAEIHRPKIIH